MKPLPHQRHGGARRRPGWKQNNPGWASWRRLSTECVRAILMTRSSSRNVSAQLKTKYHIDCCPDMVRKIRAGKRRLDVSRVGTLYENPAPPQRATPTWAKRKPIRNRPAYLDRRLRLRPGAALVEKVAS